MWGIALVALCLSAAPELAPKWEEFAREDGFIFTSRPKAGSGVRELKATGIFDATAEECWAVLRDYPNWSKTMPYTEEGTVLSTEENGKVVIFHGVVKMPLVSRREYIIKLLDESDWREGHGYLLVTWTATNTDIKPKEGMVRVPINTGSWKLEPREGGKKTFATYYHHTIPGGSVPDLLANTANPGAMRAVVKAIRKTVEENRQKKMLK